MIDYLIFGISISFISWIVGLILNAVLVKTSIYPKISNLNFVRSKRVNKKMGLKYFNWLVKNTPFKYFNQKIVIDQPNVDLEQIRKEMTIAEIGHLIGFIFVMGFALYKGIKEDYRFGLVIMGVNVMMNLYPSLLQQENKRRIDIVIRRQRSLSSSNNR